MSLTNSHSITPPPKLVSIKPGKHPVYYHDANGHRHLVTEPGVLIQPGEATGFDGFASCDELARILIGMGWICQLPK